MGDDIKKLFEEFLGTERFEKFIAQGFEPRLRFWQEQELERFYVQHPELRIDLDDIKAILRICQVHRIDLKAEAPSAVYDCVIWGYRERGIIKKYFPHAELFPIGKSTVWYCEACRSAHQAWQDGTLPIVDN